LESCIKATVNVTMFLTWLKHLRHNHCSHIKLCFCYTHNSTREACVQNKHISYTDLYSRNIHCCYSSPVEDTF